MVVFFSKLKEKSIVMLCLILTLIFSISFLTCPSRCYVSQCFAASEINNELINTANPIKKFFENLFNPQPQGETNNFSNVEVYVGGIPLGFALACDGAVVVSTGDVLTANGPINPSLNAKIIPGDIIYKINNQKIDSAQTISNIINSNEIAGKQVDLVIIRNGAKINSKITPALDISSNSFKLGLWIRDDAAGVGTLSYIRTDNLRFGALGHPVCDIDTNSILPISSGEIYACDIVGVNRGKRGTPGELRGIFLRNGINLGVLDNNTNFGVFGQIDENNFNLENLTKMQIASPSEVSLGPAIIRSTILGQSPKDYSIEIIKTNAGNREAKNMVIRITDKTLLDATGGIVQGMSGSPIIQNNKLIGVVTHVFVSDPTKGFGSFVTNMIDS